MGDRNDNQNGKMEQVHSRGKVRIIRKSAKRVDDGMDDDAGEQAAAAIKNRDQQEPQSPYRFCKSVIFTVIFNIIQ